MRPSASRLGSRPRRGAVSRRAFLKAFGVAAGAGALQGLSPTAARAQEVSEAAASSGSIVGPQFYQVLPGTQNINFNIGASTPPPLRELEFAMCGDPTALEIIKIVGNNGDGLTFASPIDPIQATLQSMDNPLRSTSNVFTITLNNKTANNQPLAIGATFKGVT